MEPVGGSARRLEACASTAIGRVEVLQCSWDAPIDISGTCDVHWLQLSLLPISPGARGCYPDRWGPHRFEPIGQVFLIPAGQMLHSKSDCRRQNSIAFIIRPTAVHDWFDAELEWTDGRLQGGLDIVNPVIRNLLFRLGEEVRHPGFAGDVLAEMMAGQIVIELARHLMGIEERRAVGGLAPWRIRLIDERLAEVSKSPSLAELAGLCNLSVRQMTRAFRASRGCSIGTYIANSRIDHAKRLLASGSAVKAIAHDLGFNSPSNFYFAFRRATGETPSQYRHRTGHNHSGVRPGVTTH
jgi:AraC family transcriptional regulator